MPKGTRSITVIRKPKVDKLSPTSGSPTTGLPISGVAILPRQAKEEGRGWIMIDGWDIYILASSRAVDDDGPRPFADGDILPSDLILIDGDLWEVDGNPAPYDKGHTRKATLVKVKTAGASFNLPDGPLPFPVTTEWDGDDLVAIIQEELDA